MRTIVTDTTQTDKHTHTYTHTHTHRNGQAYGYRRNLKDLLKNERLKDGAFLINDIK